MPSDYAGHLTTVANGSQWLTCRVQYLDDTDPFSSTNFPEPTRPPSYTFNVDLPLCEQLAGVHRLLKAPHKIDDCTLQISHTGAYLDLDLSITEQKEEFEKFFTDGKRNSVIVRTLLSVRVHSCIEKLYNSKGRELRRALFSLKQIFQDDKDLVHEFVNADGLTCLIKVGAEADQNYQNYILRALGQIMLYVDGMNGVIEHSETVRWLYTLIASRFRLVVKTTLKLLLVFVEYAETNALLLLDAVREVDKKRRQKEWANVMRVLDEKDGIDCELLVYAMTLINKTISNIPDQDTFYDVTDALEAHGMETISQRHLNKKGNDLDLLEQFKIYELALKHEDGDEEASKSSAPGVGIKWNRERTKSELEVPRKSVRRHSANLFQQIEVSSPEKFAPPPAEEHSKSTPCTPSINPAPETPQFNKRSRNRRHELSKQHLELQQTKKAEQQEPASPQADPTISPKPWLVKKPSVNADPPRNFVSQVQYNNAVNVDLKERERRRRNRDEDRDKKRAEFLSKQQNALNNRPDSQNGEVPITNGTTSPPPPPVRSSSSKMLEISTRARMRRSNFHKMDSDQSKESPEKHPQVMVNGVSNHTNGSQHPKIRMDADTIEIEEDVAPNVPEIVKKNNTPLPASLSLSPAIQKPTQLTASPKKHSGLMTPSGDVISNNQKFMMDMLYANQAVALKQGSESDDGSEGSTEAAVLKENGVSETPSEKNTLKTTPVIENESSNNSEPSDMSISSAKAAMEKMFGGKPMKTPQTLPEQNNKVERTLSPEPAKPKKDSDIMWEKLLLQSSKQSLLVSDFDFTDLTEKDDIDILAKPKLPMSTYPPGFVPPPPPPPGMGPPPPPPPPMAPPPPPPACSPTPPPNSPQSMKRRTVRLFWKEVKSKTESLGQKVPSVWQDIEDVKINEDKILHLFELRTKDIVKKQQIDKKNRIIILDPKRSNAINIGLTVLPPPRTIKSAILHMDEYALNKEQIEKLLTMIPTEEEKVKIQDAMQQNPDIPLGSAEQFLLTLSSISELSARLHLWSFKLDYEALEKEIAEPLTDLRDGMKQLRENKTFRCILAVLKSVGNFLNGTKANGFDIKYLAKVPEVKDTVHKQSLLHHLTQLVLEHFPNTTDLYSDIGSITRASRGDFPTLEETLDNLESRCKQSWDHLKTIAKHETKATQRNKMSDFLLSSAQRIITLGVVHRRLINRFHQTLVYFGMSPEDASKMEVQSFCRLISEFALEYRTSRERVVTQQQKKQTRGERSKTRGKMITEEEIFSDASEEPDDFVFHMTRKFSHTEEQVKQMKMESALKLGAGDVRVDRRQRSRSSRVKKEPTSPVANGHVINSEMNGGPPPEEAPVRRRHSRKAIADDRSDEKIMDELVKVATQTPQERTVHRRKRSRNASRKSLRRTLRNGLTDEEKAVIMGKF
uniref:FH1/FH2 domain-containing protein 3-like isoform X1 n=1 Tax=Styela clava TaxID=7725 RepID=UPI001939A1C7|nr:FH1/FH2 domain-containing protein 3-like isoform X1 [Styela clava]